MARSQVAFVIDPPLKEVHFGSVFHACHKALDFLRRYASRSHLDVHSMSALLVPRIDEHKETFHFFPLSVIGVPVPVPPFAHVPPQQPASLSQWACELRKPVLYGDLLCERPPHLPWEFLKDFRELIKHYRSVAPNEDIPQSLVVIPLVEPNGSAWGVISLFFVAAYGYIADPNLRLKLLKDENVHPAHPQLVFPQGLENIKEWQAEKQVYFDLPESLPDLPQQIALRVGETFRTFGACMEELSEYLEWSICREQVSRWAKPEQIDLWSRLPLKAFSMLSELSKERTGRRTVDKGFLADAGMKRVAVLFADMRGFTSTCRLLGQSYGELPEILIKFFNTMWEIIVKNGGEVDKFEGDGIMALFGTAYRYDSLQEADLAFHAVQAAVEMCQQFPRTRTDIIRCLKKRPEGEQIAKRVSKTLTIGIGIMVGQAQVDFFGAEWQRTFTALGPLVNDAKKLETQAAKPGKGKKRPWGNILLAFGHEAAAHQRAFHKLQGLVSERFRKNGLRLTGNTRLEHILPDCDSSLKARNVLQVWI